MECRGCCELADLSQHLTCCSLLADAVWLREEWRIVGSLVGALGSHPRQNSQLGLPLSLSPDEATLLRDEGEQPLQLAQGDLSVRRLGGNCVVWPLQVW